MTKYVFCRLCLVAVSCLLLPLGSLPSWAAGTVIEQRVRPVVRDVSRLRDLIDRQGIVRAIVRLRAPETRAAGFVPEGSRLTAGQRAAQRRAIASVRRQLMAQLADYKVKMVRQFNSIPFVVLEVDDAGFASLRSSSLVDSIQEDRRITPALAESIPLIGADLAWGQGASGAGQVVAILDTGVDSQHPFLAGKVLAEACFSSNTIESISLCPNGQNQEVGPGAATPCASGCEHGTHVAGIAAGNGENLSPNRESGVAKDADIIAANIFSYFPVCSDGGAPAGDDTVPAAAGCVLAWESDIIAGLLWVYDLANDTNAGLEIAAVNMSLGGKPRHDYCRM